MTGRTGPGTSALEIMEPDWGQHLNYWAQKQLRKERDVMDMIIIEIEELESQMQETGEDRGQGQCIQTDRGDDMKNWPKEIEGMENTMQDFNQDIGQGQCTLDIIDENKINWGESTTCGLPERDIMEIMTEKIEDMENTILNNEDIGQGQCTLDITDESKINWGEHMTCGPPKQQNKRRMIKMMRQENKDLAKKIQELENENEELEDLMGIERKRDKAMRKTLRKGMDPAIKEAEKEEQKKQRDQFLIIKSLRLKIEKLTARHSPDPKPESQIKITKKLGPAWTRMVSDKIKAEKKNQELLKQVYNLQAVAQLSEEKESQAELDLQSRLESGRLENKLKWKAEEPKEGNRNKSWFSSLIRRKEKKWSEEKMNLELNREMERSYLELQLQTNEARRVSMMVDQAALKQKMLQELKQKQLRDMSETEMKERKKQEEKEWKEIEKECKKAEKKKEAQNERKTKKWWKIRWFTKKL